MSSTIGVKALAVIRRYDGALLVAPVADGRQARPIGGSIEFGESAADAVRREVHEELGCKVASTDLLGVLENRFSLDGVHGHEIVYVFGCTVAEDSIYRMERLPILDPPGGEASWRLPSDTSSELVPAGLDRLLQLNPVPGGNQLG